MQLLAENPIFWEKKIDHQRISFPYFFLSNSELVFSFAVEAIISNIWGKFIFKKIYTLNPFLTNNKILFLTPEPVEVNALACAYLIPYERKIDFKC